MSSVIELAEDYIFTVFTDSYMDFQK